MSEDGKTSKWKCAVPNCTDKFSSRIRFPNPKSGNVELFKLMQQWIEKIKNPSLFNLSYDIIYNKYRICIRHFSAKDIVPEKGFLKRVTYDAVPTLCLPEGKCRKALVNNIIDIQVP